MSRRARQGTILRLVREREISTQAELAEALREQGYEVVQTTVSRDISELGLRKVRAPSGRLVYAPPGSTNGDRFREIVLALRRWALTFEASGNLVVIVTPSGYANAARPGDRRGRPSADRRHDRRRQHDSRRRARGRHRRASCATSYDST